MTNSNRNLRLLIAFAALSLAACASGAIAPRMAGTQLRSAAATGTHTFAEYPITGQTFQLSLGTDGNVWFAETFDGLIGRITPAGQLTEFPIGVAGLPRDVAPGPDGKMWFTIAHSNGAGYVASIDSNGAVVRHALPDAGPRFLTTGPDGNIWYTDQSGFVGKFSLSGTATLFALPAGADPRGITVGSDGRLWFADFGTGKIGAITIDGAISEYNSPTTPFGVPAVTDDQVWFLGQNQLLSATPGGHVRAVTLPDLPGGVLAAADGQLWTAFQDLNEIALVNRGGHVMQTYPIPSAGANPVGMTYGSDGNMWFSEPLAAQPQIGVLRL